MLRPHPPGTRIRVWESARVVDEHELIIHRHGTVLRCKYCKPVWERGLYNRLPYRRDTRNGWWEYDAGECECIWFTKDGTVMNWGKQFYAVVRRRGVMRDVPWPHLTVHVCDCASAEGVRDMQDNTISWEEVFSMVSLRKLCRRFLPGFQTRLQEKQQDRIGRYLFIRDWSRTRLCNYALNAVVCDTDVKISKFLPGRFYTRHEYQV